MLELKTRDEINIMREAGRVVAEVLDMLEASTEPGISLADLDRKAGRLLQKRGATSSFLGYQLGQLPPFPKVICTSVNEGVVHGIPSDRKLFNGDIISYDFACSIRGFHADAARTVGVGKISDERAELIHRTWLALGEAIMTMQSAATRTAVCRIGDVSAAIQNYGEKHGYSVVKDYTGHGIGRRMHEEPMVPNWGKANSGMRLKEGMVLALEPIFNAGSADVGVLPDKWSIVTVDRKDSAHFEHTVAITRDGPEILTKL